MLTKRATVTFEETIGIADIAIVTIVTLQKPSVGDLF